MLYRVKEDSMDIHFDLELIIEVSLDNVWENTKNMFPQGSKVLISDENGNAKYFHKGK